VRERVAPLVTRTSYEGGWKVVMVWYADRLQEDAANALLKMLEEPPPRTLFLLVADSDQPLLSTIASRCQRLYAGGGRPPRLAPETRAALLDLLAEGPGAGYVERVAHAARFAARLAAVRAELEKSDPAADGDDDAAREVRDARINARLLEARDEALELAARALRDVLLCRLGRPAAELHWPERADVSRRLAQRVTPGAALRNLRLVEEAHTQMERYLAESQVLESFYLRWEEDAAERNGP